jgi:hypothetical protein
MCVNLYSKYTSCGHTNRSGHEPCLNTSICGARRERIERVEGLCQRCIEALRKMYRMNGLDFNTRSNGMVLGEPGFENQRRRVEERLQRWERGDVGESGSESQLEKTEWRMES